MSLFVRFIALSIACLASMLGPSVSLGQSASEDFFETRIRPLLIQKCFECHASAKQFNGLRLDSREALLRGGDSGAALQPGEPEKSLVYQAVLRHGDLQMPPEKPLSPGEIDDLRHWIQSGAMWPAQKPGTSDSVHGHEKHWAFQPIVRPAIPNPQRIDRCVNPIDCFIQDELEKHGLNLSARERPDRLRRRLHYSLTGLPEEIDTQSADTSHRLEMEQDSYDSIVDRLLNAPAFGQHLARLWLDIARYSDTKGYVYAREERFFVHASSYRNWIIDSINSDLPYDRFLQLQVAADQYSPDDPRDWAAMGFVTLGRRFLGVTHDIIDDRIDVVTRGTLGLTVACARCHDHKYDPIPTTDYYALHGVFQNSLERQVEIPAPAFVDAPTDEFLIGLKERKEKLEKKLQASRQEASDRARARIADYLYAQSELNKHPEEGFDILLQPNDLIPAFIRQWERYLAGLNRESDPLFSVWFRFASIDKDRFDVDSKRVHAEVVTLTNIHPKIRESFSTPPSSLREVAERYATALQSAQPTDQSDLLTQVLYGRNSPCVVPDEEVVNIEFYFDNNTCVDLWKLQGEVDRWRLQQKDSPAMTVSLQDREISRDSRVLKRGNPANKGEFVRRRFLSRLQSSPDSYFQSGSGRQELAEAITDPRNPLTARVWVNRIWQHYFGSGLVKTPSDFGLRAEGPSHPQLLDWLARELIDNDWSSKHIHRLIVTSATFQQSSQPSAEGTQRGTPPQQLDPENKLLWRMPVHRLTLEELRDSLLRASQELDARYPKKPMDLFGDKDTNRRRSIFGLVDRQFLSNSMRLFDFANPDLHIAKRSDTTIPQQSLFLLNHPFLAKRAKSLIHHLSNHILPGDQGTLVRHLYRSILARQPTDEELKDSLQFLNDSERSPMHPISETSRAWSYGFGEVDENTKKLKEFKVLPYYASGAWRGGADYPDKKLGWVQLTASGGHPGNDLQHASVRRWTAPADGTIRIRSLARHEPDAGDGIRIRILSSAHGELRSQTLRAGECAIDLDHIRVAVGDTIDFIADIHEGLNSDQYLWAPIVSMDSRVWDANKDFSGPTIAPLTSLEQLAQMLFLSNEFMFID